MLGGVLRSGGTARRLAAGAVLLACLIGLPGTASADADQKLTVTGPTTVNEDGTAAYTIALSDGADEDATVNVTVTALGGANSADFSATTGEIIVKKGEPYSFKVSAIQDALDEDDSEAFKVTLSDPVRASIDGTGVATTTITDDDDPPIVKIVKAADVTEGGVARFPITLDRVSGRSVNVTFRTANGTAESGSDFNGTSNATVEIAAGAITGEVQIQTIETINVLGQKIAESDETFSVTLIASA